MARLARPVIVALLFSAIGCQSGPPLSLSTISPGGQPLLPPAQLPPAPEMFVTRQGLICGVLEYWKDEGGASIYLERAAGCVWVYLLDAGGNIVAGTRHECAVTNPPRALRIEGPHSFGCDCNATPHVCNINGASWVVADRAARQLAPNQPGLTQCSGNACNAVSVTWTGHGYDIRNLGGRPVRVRIRFLAGFQCLEPTDVDLNAGEVKSLDKGGYCIPYEANYL